MTASGRPGWAVVRCVLGSLALACVPGCVSEGPPVRPKPVALPQQPQGLRVDRLVVAASNFPEDANGNGYYDTIVVTVYLYSGRWALPIVSSGTMEFALLTHEGQRLAGWVIPPSRFEREARRFNPGPGYQFRLSLLDEGTDQLPVGEGELRWRFTPEVGAPIAGYGSTVLVGPTTVGR